MPRSQRQSKPNRRVAVLVDTSTSWGRRIIEGVHRYQSQHANWQLFVEPRGTDQRRWLPQGWVGDGVIARVGFPELAGQLNALGIPVVNVSLINLPDARFPRVVANQEMSAKLAAEHFLGNGFRNFAYFSLLGLDYVGAHQRAFARHVTDAGCSCAVYEAPPQDGMAEPDWTLDLNRLGAWLSSLPKPVAIFTWNTSSARELVYACVAANLKVPEDIAILSGVDDDLFCKVAPIPISAINPAGEEIGYQAAARLDSLMRRKPAGDVPDLMIPPLGIIKRQSTETLAVEDESVARALRYIREDPARTLKVSEIAQQAGICRRSLEQRFHKLLGRSPAGEIRRVRLEKAVELLQGTNLTVAAIAERSGFSTAEYMASAFRAHFGAAPSSFRQPD